jgi:UDP-N-acetylmuramate dehydrogenase
MAIDIEKKVQRNIPLAPFTTMQLGGPAKLFVKCESEDEITSALRYANAKSIPVHVLGSGSNTIFADQGYQGLVIKVANKGIVFKKQKGSTVISGNAGENWDNLVRQCVNRGLAGFECLSGVPGSVGAAPVQNIGAYGQEVSQLITQVTVINRKTLDKQTFTRAECQFGYRVSRFKDRDAGKYIISGVVFKTKECQRPTMSYPDIIQELGGESKVRSLDCSATSLKKIRQAVLSIRKRKSMLIDKKNDNFRSCGSFFINPIISKPELTKLQSKEDSQIPSFQANSHIKIPAAWLIEKAGFPKGFRYKGVGISPHHNLAIVNYTGTTDEVINLAQKIQKAVKQKFDIELTIEPVFIPHTQ